MRRLPLFWVPLLAVAAGACKSTPYPTPGTPATVVREHPLRLAFVPPDGKLLHEKSVTSRTEGGVTERIESTTTSRYDHLKTGGWTLTQWVPQLEVTRAEQPVESPLVELVTRFPVKLELADDGAFIRLANPADAEAAIASTFPDPVQAAQWLRFFSPAAIEQQSQREWESKYAGLFNRNLVKGTKLYSIDSVVAGGEPRYFLVERTLTGRSQSSFGETAVFDVRCTGNLDEVQQRDAAARLLTLWGNPPLEPSVQCEGQQFVAITPFVPTRSWLRLTVRPSADAPEVTLNRDVSALKLE